jgi:hypothetical protein
MSGIVGGMKTAIVGTTVVTGMTTIMIAVAPNS